MISRIPNTRSWFGTSARAASPTANAVTTPYLVDLIIQAEQDGYDAVVSHCFGSPGIPEGRELVNIPVVGAGEAAFYVAMMCGDRLGVITVGGTYRTPSHGAMMHLVRKMVREYAITDRVFSIRTTGQCVEDCADEEVLFDSLLREAEKSIDDGAEVIILGCTGMINTAEKLQAKLEAPVVDPSVAALKFAELLISMNLTHSKLTLPSPDMIGVKCEMKWPPTMGRWPRGGKE